jgi:hypothetical protein
MTDFLDFPCAVERTHGLAVKGEDAGSRDLQEDQRAVLRFAEAPQGVRPADLVGPVQPHPELH